VFSQPFRHTNRRDTHTHIDRALSIERKSLEERRKERGEKHHSTELAAAYQTPNIDNDGSHDAACPVIGYYAKKKNRTQVEEEKADKVSTTESKCICICICICLCIYLSN